MSTISTRFLSAIQQITQTLSSTIDPDEGLGLMLTIAAEAVSAVGGAIWQHDPVRRTLTCRYVVGENSAVIAGHTLPDTQGIVGQTLQTVTSVVDNRVAKNPRHYRQVDEMSSRPTRNMVSVPVLYPGGVCVAVLQLVNKPGGFKPRDVTLLESISAATAMSLHVADLGRQAARTAALDYVGHFAHDIQNKLQASAGLESFRGHLRGLLGRLDQEAPGAELVPAFEELIEIYLDPAITDGEVVRRYMRLIASLVKGTARVELKRERRDLRETIESEVYRIQRVARDHQVTLVASMPPEPVVCAYDALLIGSAVYNLINNALPEAEGHNVVLRLFADGDDVVIEVRDTGRGMPPSVLDSILHGNPVSTRENGTGLGTLIVKRVTELHDGVLEGESALGVGTAFRMRLPANIAIEV